MRFSLSMALLSAGVLLVGAGSSPTRLGSSARLDDGDEPLDVLQRLQQRLNRHHRVSLDDDDTGKLLVLLAKQLLEDNQDLRTELQAFRDHTQGTLKAHAEEHQRTRRALSDNTTLEKLDPQRKVVSPIDELVGNYQNLDHFATTRAQQWSFFTLTSSNSEIEINTRVADISAFQDSRRLFRGYCLALASSERCVDVNCTGTTSDDVPQLVYSWSTAFQSWSQTGPGATGPQTGPNSASQYRPIVAHGVRALTHMSPDGVRDMIVPAASTQDVVPGVSTPTKQCGDVWSYVGKGAGYAKYQDCAWHTNGSHFVAAFQFEGEQYLVSTSMVHREYDSLTSTLVQETYSGQIQYVFKWSYRTSDNSGRAMPHGFFLTDDANPDVGNGGHNAFQHLEGLHGVVHVEAFQIRGVQFLAFSEHVSSAACDEMDGSTRPSCQTVHLESHLYFFAPFAQNPRGDCRANGAGPADCQTFRGQFIFLQSIPTKGAKAMHHFTVNVTGETVHFLAVAEHRDDNYRSVQSGIYRWNGAQFGLHQRIPTNYAQAFSSYHVGTRTFLVVANRGCPEVPRESIQVCSAPAARAQTLVFEPLQGHFVFVSETDDVGHLHTHNTNLLAKTSEEVETAFAEHGLSALPAGVTAFSVPALNFGGFLENTPAQYILVANNMPTEATTIPAASCPSQNRAVCSHPSSLFVVSAVVTDGLQSQINNIGRKVAENNLFLQDLETQLSGGAAFVSGWRRDRGLDLRTYTGTTAEAFAIGAEQYLALGFEQAFLPRDTCIERYTEANGNQPTHCGGVAIATQQHCLHSATCARQPTMISYDTETIIYKVGAATQGLNFRGERVNTQVPRLIEVQRLPSMGVQDLHFFQLTKPTTQAKYEACGNTSAENCYRNLQLPVDQFLVVANGLATCEWDYINNMGREPVPERAVYIYAWNNKTMQFDFSSRIEHRCKVTAVDTFEVKCQPDTAVTGEVPTCSTYMVLAENCVADLAFTVPANGPAVEHRISFHKWDAVARQFQACQPYGDPSDPRNLAESPCFQSTDAQRAPGMVAPKDQHQFDFPDILPTTLQVGIHLLDNGTDYYPQLENAAIGDLEFVIPRGQKSLFYQGSDPKTQDAVRDLDQDVKTLYHANGRTNYEIALMVTYNKQNTPAQVFGLTALYAKSAACATGHPTTPRRRFFQSIQRGLTTMQGGRGVATFERIGLDGIERSYAVFAEGFRRRTGRASSLYVHDPCNEYTQYDAVAEIDFNVALGGSIGPAALDGQLLCPYSLDEAHQEAWEQFYNFYHPISPCRGRVANPDRFQGVTIEVPFYNMPPPAERLSARGATLPRDKYVYPRPAGKAVTVDSHGFTQDDYQYLHDHRDDVMVHLQDFATFDAKSVAVKRICGSEGQVWLVFGHAGINYIVDNNFQPAPGQVLRQPERNRFYVWNDRYAVPENSKTDCTAAAAEALIEIVGAQFAVLGCFERIVFTSPVNTGASYAVTFFTQGDFLFLSYLNNGDTSNNAVDPTMCANTAADPSGKQHAPVAGVISPILALDLSQLGGLQCRSTDSAAHLTVSLDDVVDLGTLRQTFVTLDSAQTITGAKTFSASQTIFDGSVVVSGEVGVMGDLSAANVHAMGLVDGVDVSELAEEMARIAIRLLERVTKLQADVCHAQTIADAVAWRHTQLAHDVRLRHFLGNYDDPGWVEYEGFLYQLSTSQENWSAAEATCQTYGEGAHLASVQSQAENIFIFQGLVGNDTTVRVWLGGYLVAPNYVFVWSDGSAFDIESQYNPWQQNEPSGLPGHEECIQMGHTTNVEPGGWKDAQCSTALLYVCKMPVPSVMCSETAQFSFLENKCVQPPPLRACEATAKETSCLPKSTLLSAGWETLRASFMGFVAAKYPSTNISNVEFSVYTTSVLFVVHGASAATLDVSEFFDPLVCKNQTQTVSGTTALQSIIRWTELHCAEFDLFRIDQLRKVLTLELAFYGITAPDVQVLDVACDPAVVELEVISPDLFASELDMKLRSRHFWQAVHNRLITIDASFWGTGLLEFANEEFIPDRNLGSGDGDGDGEGQGGL